MTVRGSGAAGVTGSCATAGRTVAVTRRRLDRVGLRARLRPRRRLAVGDLLGLPRGDRRHEPRGGPALRRARTTRARCPARPSSTPAAPARSRTPSCTRTRSATSGSPTAAATACCGATWARSSSSRPPPPPVAGNALSNPGAEAGTPADDDAVEPRAAAVDAAAARSRSSATARSRASSRSRRGGWGRRSARATRSSPPARARATRPRRWSTCATPRRRSTSARAPRRSRRCSAATARARTARSSRPTYRGPGGDALGSLQIGPVTAADRAGATNLLPRAASGAIPPLTRSIAVTLRSVPSAGSYDDAYFDSVALVPSVAGAAPHEDPAPGRAGGCGRSRA